MKKMIVLALTQLFAFHYSLLTMTAQPGYDLTKLSHERLDRGVVAIRNGEKVVVSWRTLASDGTGQPFDLYRNGVKLNDLFLSEFGHTFYFDYFLNRNQQLY